MNTPTATTPFRVTGDAARQILEQARGSGVAGPALRVVARQEADGSLSYGMGFDDVAPDDEPLQFGELTVLLARGSEPLLDGTVLDFVELQPGSFHFVFIPPEAAAGPAAGGCGQGNCGSCG